MLLNSDFSQHAIITPDDYHWVPSHQPSSRDGTSIFVKLRQMSADERHPVRINTQEAANWLPSEPEMGC